MQAAVAMVVSLAKTVWPLLVPLLVPLLTQVAQQLGAEFIALVKTNKLPAQYAFLAPIATSLETQLSNFLTPAAISAEVAKLTAL